MTIKKPSQFEIKIFDHAGAFSENKDIARKLREEIILPKLKAGNSLILNYEKVGATTQSFTHALISQSIRENGSDVLEKILFKNCNEEVKRIIGIVVEYMQGNMENPISQE